MLLDVGRPFVGFIPVRVLENESCSYREVYEAEASDGSKVFLTVYDTTRMPESMSEGICEFEFTRRTKHELFQTFLDSGEKMVGTARYLWMTTGYYTYGSLRDMALIHALGEEDIRKLFRELIPALRELEYLTSGGGHFNLNYDVIHVTEGPDNQFSFHLVGLQHVGKCCQGSPKFDVNTLNPCFRARETSLGLFQPFTVVYAMAMLLVYSWQGSLPFDICEDYGWARIKSVIQEKKPNLYVPEDLKPVLMKALENNCRRRYRDVSEFANALRGYLGLEKPEIHETGNSGSEETDCKERQVDRNTVRPGLKAVAGMGPLKTKLKRDFVDILAHIELARQYGIAPANYLFYGPPGTGKTFISLRLAEECGLDCRVIYPADLGSVYLHGTQEKIKRVFEEAAKKAEANRKGYILIFDEFDAFCPIRTLENDDKQAGEVAEFLTQLNSCVEKHVYCIGTTNCLDRIDPAVTRHGRMDSLVYIGLPDALARKELFELELRNRPHDPEINLDLLVEQTAGYTGSDITHIVQETARCCFAQSIADDTVGLVRIDQAKLAEVIRNTRPSVTEEEVRRYERMRDEYDGKKPTTRRRIGFKA